MRECCQQLKATKGSQPTSTVVRELLWFKFCTVEGSGSKLPKSYNLQKPISKAYPGLGSGILPLLWRWFAKRDLQQNLLAEAAMEITLVFIIVLVMMLLGCSAFDRQYINKVNAGKAEQLMFLCVDQ